MRKGISLVALVITIIVLIILTSTVMIMFNNGGIADRAEEAVFNTNFTTLIEMTTMANNDYMLENLGTEKITTEDVRSALQKYDNQNLLNRDIKGFKCYELLQIYDGKLYQKDMVEQEDKELSDKLTALGIEKLSIFKEYKDTLGIFEIVSPDVSNMTASIKFKRDIQNADSIKEIRIPNVIYNENGEKYYVNYIYDDSIAQLYPELEKVIVSKPKIANNYTLAGRIFQDCKKLKTVELPVGIEHISAYLFSGCTSLTTINLPEGLLSFGGYYGYTFSNCTSLKEITIPTTVFEIGWDMFYGCSSDLHVKVKNTKEYYDTCETINKLWDYSLNKDNIEYLIK